MNHDRPQNVTAMPTNDSPVTTEPAELQRYLIWAISEEKQPRHDGPPFHRASQAFSVKFSVHFDDSIEKLVGCECVNSGLRG
jgi:hypothetical protein